MIQVWIQKYNSNSFEAVWDLFASFSAPCVKQLTLVILIQYFTVLKEKLFQLFSSKPPFFKKKIKITDLRIPKLLEGRTWPRTIQWKYWKLLFYQPNAVAKLKGGMWVMTLSHSSFDPSFDRSTHGKDLCLVQMFQMSRIVWYSSFCDWLISHFPRSPEFLLSTLPCLIFKNFFPNTWSGKYYLEFSSRSVPMK